MTNAPLWERLGNTWHFLPIPGVCVIHDHGLWTAFCSGEPMAWIRRSARSEDVKRDVYEYFDRRVNF